jgi:hypothetical protein
MNPNTAECDAMEATRREYLDELTTHGEPDDEFVPGSYGCHEVLDRTAMLMKTVDEYILGHPACVNNKEWFALAYQAVDALNQLYQRVGAEHLEKTTDPELRTD